MHKAAQFAIVALCAVSASVLIYTAMEVRTVRQEMKVPGLRTIKRESTINGEPFAYSCSARANESPADFARRAAEEFRVAKEAAVAEREGGH